jgi:hypothetical protein
MPAKRARPRRLAVRGAHIQFANTVAELLNMSTTGALIRMGFELRKGGEWPLVLDLPSAPQVWLNGRVVRCRREAASYVLALAFVAPSAEAQAVLNGACSASGVDMGSGEDGAPKPHRPKSSLQRLGRLLLSLRRQCPECRSADVTKERRRHYSCFQCGCRFTGFRLGPIRLSV